jgi:predicted membrane GTPase involved in stress response
MAPLIRKRKRRRFERKGRGEFSLSIRAEEMER